MKSFVELEDAGYQKKTYNLVTFLTFCSVVSTVFIAAGFFAVSTQSSQISNLEETLKGVRMLDESLLSPKQSQIAPLPSLREQREETNAWLSARINTVIPELMKENGVSMWMLSMSEYAEDTVFWSLKNPITQFAARRRTVMLYYFENDEFKTRELIDNTEKVWSDISSIIESAKPHSITLDVSNAWFKFSDGLHAGERDRIYNRLEKYVPLFNNRPMLAVNYIQKRVPGMLPRYKQIMDVAWEIIQEGFSNDVITPGVTTTQDVVWWFREKIRSQGLSTWFQPSVSAFRASSDSSNVIQRGDMLHCDFGITSMGLNTDTQHMAYVLKLGETGPPAGLIEGLRRSNRMQDILMNTIKIGKTGNMVLREAKALVSNEGITGTIYCHPVGDWGHSSGPVIGMTNLQDGVPVSGDAPFIAESWFSIELQASFEVPEWGGKTISFMQEEDAALTSAGNMEWIKGRQENFYIIN